jgi:peptide chain release factor 2
VSEPDFWKDQAAAQKLLQRRRRVEEERDLGVSLKRRADDLAVLVEWAQSGEAVGDELEQALGALASEVEAAEVKKMLGGELDRKDAILTIHPGAGGTESQDWAEMLLRMYLRWAERRGFKADVVDLQPGDEAGIKTSTSGRSCPKTSTLRLTKRICASTHSDRAAVAASTSTSPIPPYASRTSRPAS